MWPRKQPPLTPEQILRIKQAYTNGVYIKVIAKRFNRADRTISKIVKEKRYE